MLRIIQHQLVIHFRRVNQPYLLLLYQTIFSTMYFGLLRVSEVAQSNDTDHAVKARDVHVGDNKRKFLLVLRTSKTHWKNMKPQLIKIAAKSAKTKQKHSEHNKLLCPYQLLRDFSAVRGGFVTVDELFFTFADRSPVTPRNVNNCLCTIIKEAGFDASLYSSHSIRTGRTTDLYDLDLSVETIKKIGRWRSNAVFRYLRS